MGLAQAVDALMQSGIQPTRVLLIGGAAANASVQAIAATIFTVPVHVPAPGEYVADGAARQAAWALSGESSAPQWAHVGIEHQSNREVNVIASVREQYEAAQEALYGLP